MTEAESLRKGWVLGLSIRLLCAGVLGFVTTVLVAYVLAVRYEPWDEVGYPPRGTQLDLLRTSSIGVTRYEGTEFVPEDALVDGEAHYKAPASVLVEVIAQPQRSSEWGPYDGAPGKITWHGRGERFETRHGRALNFRMIGWPARCFYGWSEGVDDTNPDHNFGLVARPAWTDAFASSTELLPYYPWWRGVVVNVAVFGAVWFGLLFVPGIVKRRLRGRRGACVACGYALVGLGAGVKCPECGGDNAAAG